MGVGFKRWVRIGRVFRGKFKMEDPQKVRGGRVSRKRKIFEWSRK